MKPRSLAALFVGPQGLRPGWGILLFLVTGVAIYLLLLLVAPIDFASELGLFMSEAMLLASVSAGTALMAWVEGRGVLSYGLSGPRAWPRFLWGSFWGAALLTLLVGALLASGHLAIERGFTAGADAIGYGITYAGVLLVVAFAEEMLFRGYLQVTLARLIGFWPAACLLSLGFGLVHRGNPGENDVGLVSAMLIGGALCLCLRLSGSLWWGIGFHAAWNWAQAFLWGTPVSGFVLEGRWFEAQSLGDPLWSGGTTGPEGSLLCLPILGLTALVIVRSFRRGDAAVSA
ncbi:MAG TPA: type II CAAX endopeptidase family protein [Stellaceae bacterium]|nr:type II CAAX endopeptidase family protein [Stellaceae bacterium]